MEVSGQLHNPTDLSVGKEPNLPVEYGPRIAQGTLQWGGGGRERLLLAVIEPRFLGVFIKFRSRYGKKKRAYRPHYAETDALQYLYPSRRDSIHRIKL